VGADKTLTPDPHNLANGYHDFAVEDSLVVPLGIASGDYSTTIMRSMLL
jgi:hypothetical protein